MTRAGFERPRGLSPRDDIHHRTMEWDRQQNRWKPRLAGLPSHDEEHGSFGRGSAVRRLGAAVDLRPRTKRAYDQGRVRFGHHGPYAPISIQACQEQELAYEYRHGNIAYGAFTFNFLEELRSGGSDRRSVTDVVESVGHRLSRLGCLQRPKVVGTQYSLTGHFW